MNIKKDIKNEIQQNDNQEISLLNQNQQQQCISNQQDNQRTDSEIFQQSTQKNLEIQKEISNKNQHKVVQQSSQYQQNNLTNNQQQENFKEQLNEFEEYHVKEIYQQKNEQLKQDLHSNQLMKDQQKEKTCQFMQIGDTDSNTTQNQNKIIKQTNQSIFDDNQQNNYLQTNDNLNQTSNINNLNQTQQQQNANIELLNQNNKTKSIKKEEQIKQSNQNFAKQQSQSQQSNSKLTETILFPENEQNESNPDNIVNYDYSLAIDISDNVSDDVVAYAGNIFNEFNKNNLIFYYDDRDKLQMKSSQKFLSQQQIANFKSLKIRIDDFFMKLSRKNNFDDLYYITRMFIKSNKI